MKKWKNISKMGLWVKISSEIFVLILSLLHVMILILYSLFFAKSDSSLVYFHPYQ
jgi:hypothetical protein